jgi:membrane-bound lytic murein transglycosylase A
MAHRRPRRKFLIPLIVLVAAVVGGWLWWRLIVPPAPGPLRLVPARYAALPGWKGADPRPALAALRRSCALLAKKPETAPMGGAGYAGHAGDWRPVCAALPPDLAKPAAARAYFERWFRPVAVSAGAVQKGLFTGYYEPELKASHTRHGPYRTPVYGLPADLVTADLGAFGAQWAHEHIAGRVEGHRLVPYPDRAEIDRNGLAQAPVLFYAKDPVAAFFLHIQGSGRVVFDDGRVARVAYAAQNGRPYTAIGRTLIAEGAIPRETVSLQSIRAWLKAHPGEARRVMETDRSYVFFKELPLADPALGAAGSEGVPLTPGASLAVDPRLHPLGVPFFVAATAPDPDPKKPDRPFNRLLVAQDTGGAIRGPVRGDVFWGFGADAQAIAGRMKAQGRLFVLLPKALAARLGDGKEFPGTAP